MIAIIFIALIMLDSIVMILFCTTVINVLIMFHTLTAEMIMINTPERHDGGIRQRTKFLTTST
jgi:hypothetical protein